MRRFTLLVALAADLQTPNLLLPATEGVTDQITIHLASGDCHFLLSGVF